MKNQNCLSIFLRKSYLVSFLLCQNTHGRVFLERMGASVFVFQWSPISLVFPVVSIDYSSIRTVILGNCDAKHIFNPSLFELEKASFYSVSSRQSGFDEDQKRSTWRLDKSGRGNVWYSQQANMCTCTKVL